PMASLLLLELMEAELQFGHCQLKNGRNGSFYGVAPAPLQVIIEESPPWKAFGTSWDQVTLTKRTRQSICCHLVAIIHCDCCDKKYFLSRLVKKKQFN